MPNLESEHSYFFSTHAKFILSEWSALHDLIVKHTTLIKKSKASAAEEETIKLTDRHLQDALAGPYQAFFKPIITAYALLMRYRLELNVVEHDIFKENRPILPEQQPIPKKRLAKISITDLETMQDKLNDLITQYDDQWQDHIEQWQQLLLSDMSHALNSLSDIEMKEFKDLEPFSELLDRFTLLQLPLPKTKGTDMNFKNYFKLKSDLTIHSALSRQHKPHEQAEIDKILKLLKPTLDHIQKDEKQLLENLSEAVNTIISPLKY